MSFTGNMKKHEFCFRSPLIAVVLLFTLILSTVKSYFSFLRFIIVNNTHTHTPCDIISQILWAMTGSCAKIANRMLPYSSPLLRTLISPIPSFPAIVQGGTSGLVNGYEHTHSTPSGVSEAWIMLNIEQSFIIRA